MPGVKFTDKQLSAIRDMMRIAGNFADQLHKIMIDFEMDKVEGCQLRIDINPSCSFVTKELEFGLMGTDAGFVRLSRGKNETGYSPLGTNSPEYEWLFADPAIAERIQRIVLGSQVEQPRPVIDEDRWKSDSICVGYGSKKERRVAYDGT